MTPQWPHSAACGQNERLLALLDDINAVGEPERTSTMFTAIQEESRAHTGIEVHHGKTMLWDRAGIMPTASAALTAAARRNDPTAIVWRVDPFLSVDEQGVRILGISVGHARFVQSQYRFFYFTAHQPPCGLSTRS